MTTFPTGTILGYPRIGPRRELKQALEALWDGRLSEQELEKVGAELRVATRKRLAELGLDRSNSSIPESFSFYDHVLDAALTVGAIPRRFDHLRAADGSIGLTASFTIARGEGERSPLEMTKWFDSNYHYLVPEIGPETPFSLASDRLVREVEEALAQGFRTRPVIVGPVTLLALAKGSPEAPEGFDPLTRLEDVIPVYADLLGRLQAAGADWVQLDEPALVSETLPASAATLGAAARVAYAALGRRSARPAILVAAPYGDLGENLSVLAEAPIEAIALDLVRGEVPAATAGLADKVLVGGVIDGRNVWRGDLDAAYERLGALQSLGAASVAASTSTSLLHVPYDVAVESRLAQRLVGWLAFADQKVIEVTTLARGLREGKQAIAAQLSESSRLRADRRDAPGVRDGVVRRREVTEEDYLRAPYSERHRAQRAALDLPALPITTIGSFPQTGDIRRVRAQFVRGQLPADDYEDFLQREIAAVVALQEELEVDVVVHGEAERNDMVQYFAEHLDGFAVTEHGWVQSYGSRATRPSILWGDVSRPAPISVAWAAYAQSLTVKPVKGMLTGPVTILAWSFVRDDQPRAETARQVALALREEISDLESAGIRVIQVDEPALRELLPVKKRDQADYLKWSVEAFRLATGGAAAATQVHTHLCYSEFSVVIDAIRALDADVTSIEAARSRMEVVGDLRRSGFEHGVGPGVYDIHSPRVPSIAEIESLLRRAVDEVGASRIWVNPDCGLKTRSYVEATASLRNMVAATHRVRDALSA